MPIQTEGKLSPFLRARRFAAARPHLEGRILDYGCGVGSLAEEIPAERYLGVDVDEESLALARREHPRHRFLRPEDLAAEAVRGGFDTVVALAVIEHVPDPSGFLTELSRHLRPGGRVVLTTPSPRFEWLHAALSKVGITSRHGADDHEELLALGELRSVAATAGLEVREARHFLFGMNQLVVAEAPPPSATDV